MFKMKGDSIIVNAPILEVYLPADYASAELYQVIGSNSKWFGIANFKTFRSESQLDHREIVPTYPLGISSFILSTPSETDIDDVLFKKDGVIRKCIILRFFVGDVFCIDRNLIKSADNVVILMTRLEAGKLDNVPPHIVKDIIRYAEKINGMNLKLPDSHIDALVAERYRDPNNHSRKLRFSNDNNTDKVVSVNPREDAMTSTTYQGITFEDINNSIVAACNRKKAGITDEATIMEKIIRGEKVE